MKITVQDPDIYDVSSAIGAAQAVASAASELLPCSHEYNWERQNRLGGLITALELLLILLEKETGMLESALEKAA